MKLTSIIKVASVAIALAAIPAIAEDGGMTVNGTIVAGSGTVVANLLSPANVKESMEELAKDPDATVVTDDKGNVKSVKIVKSTSSGIVVKDGEVVKTWENEPTDEDIKKKIDEIRAKLNITADPNDETMAVGALRLTAEDIKTILNASEAAK